mmetsp:Transcript_8761/g.18509  ORF Transcript_8761/g.18509 Transcript_8761/m.18509 type:complete len:211 (+) Transcript_8761:1760-2392(+)
MYVADSAMILTPLAWISSPSMASSSSSSLSLSLSSLLSVPSPTASSSSSSSTSLSKSPGAGGGTSPPLRASGFHPSTPPPAASSSSQPPEPPSPLDSEAKMSANSSRMPTRRRVCRRSDPDPSPPLPPPPYDNFDFQRQPFLTRWRRVSYVIPSIEHRPSIENPPPFSKREQQQIQTLPRCRSLITPSASTPPVPPTPTNPTPPPRGLRW